LRFQSTQASSRQAVGPPAETLKVAVEPGWKGPVKATPFSSSPPTQVPTTVPKLPVSSWLAATSWLKPPSASTQAPRKGAPATPTRWKAPMSRAVVL
jgi:hypothetical protein